MCVCVLLSNANGLMITDIKDVTNNITKASAALNALIGGSNRTGMLSNGANDITKQLKDAAEFLNGLDNPLSSEDAASLTQLVDKFEQAVNAGTEIDKQIDAFITAFKAFKVSVEKNNASSLAEVKKNNESTLKALDEAKSFTPEYLLGLAMALQKLKTALADAKAKSVAAPASNK